MKAEERKVLVNYRLGKARETLNEVSVLMKNELWNTAVNRLYYACYYAIIALLIHFKIETKTHAGVRQMLGLHFINKGIISKESGKFYSKIFDKRQTGDYEDFIDYTKEDLVHLINPANELITTIESIIRESREK